MPSKNKTTYLDPNSDIIDLLYSQKIPHRVSFTRSTTYVEVYAGNKHGIETNEKGKPVKVQTYILSNKKMSFKDLNFVKKVKNFAKNTGIPDTKIKTENVNYFRYGFHPNGVYYDVVEMDVNCAYWEIAKSENYISTEIYEQGKEIEKKTRLTALGALATVKRRYLFNGKERIKLDDDKNDITRSYFFHIAKILGDIMEEAAQEIGAKNIFFYWVDAFFVNPIYKEQLVKIFEKKGLTLKTKNVQSLNITNSKRGSRKFFITRILDKKPDRTEIEIKPFSDSDKEKEKKIIEEMFINNVLTHNKSVF